MTEARATPGIMPLFALTAASVVITLVGAVLGRPALVTFAAAGVGLAMTAAAAWLASGSRVLRPASAGEAGDTGEAAVAAANRATILAATRLGAVAYGWGAVAMQGLYLTRLTGLRWQHGWEYALVMALLCAGSLLFARRLRSGDWRGSVSLATPLAAAQALVAAGGLAFLIATGKLGSVRPDWAANRVFVALAVSILAVALATLFSVRRTPPRT